MIYTLCFISLAAALALTAFRLFRGPSAADRILAIDGTAVSTLDTLWTRLWSGGPAERDVTLEIERDGTRQNVGLRSVDRAQAIARASGV